jgi:SOS-response transcriptional repressor LexA
MEYKLKNSYMPVSPDNNQDHEFYNIPLMGQVRVETDFNTRGDYNIGELVNNIKNSDTRTISLKAMDDGLSAAGILYGDFLTVTMNAELHNNDIAAVRLGPRIYIRKIFFERSLIRLETASAKSSPLIVEARTPGFEIIGKVTSVIREL